MSAAMHAIHVAAVKQAFHRNMEFYGREEEIPQKYMKAPLYVLKKDPAAHTKAITELMSEVEGNE